MKIEVGKRYSCRDSDYFGEVYSTISNSSNYAFWVHYYKQEDKKTFVRDCVTSDGLRYSGTTNFLDLVEPLDRDYLGELK